MTRNRYSLHLAVAFATMAAPVAAQDVVRIGIDAAYRPFAYVEPSGALTGFEVELAEAVCEAIQARCEISNVPWDGIFTALDSGAIDMVGTTVTKTAARMEAYDTSVTIYNVGYGFIVPTGTDVSGGLEAIQGQAIGTIVGTEAYYAFIRGMIGEAADIRGYDTIDAAVLDLDAGRIGAVMSDNFQLQDQFVSTGNYIFVAEPVFDPQWTGDGRGWIFRQGSDELVARMDSGLEQVIGDGTMDEIAMRYFGMALSAE
jgi:ABC-type amino acid transport substrate-binding protein